jgi:prolipoprotein diacylglyceryltransferase
MGEENHRHGASVHRQEVAPRPLAAAGCRASLDAFFDALVRPEIRIGRRAWPPYRLFVLVGVVLGVTLAALLARWSGAGVARMAGVAALCVGASVAASLATSVFLGRERYTFYHYQVLVAAFGAGTLQVLGGPLVAGVEVLLLALGFVLAWGRIGCFLGGCCHGRPCGVGARYGAAHVAVGFPRCFSGVRLFPVQLAESLWLFLAVGWGSSLVAAGEAAGAGLAAFIVLQSAGRFALEYARGDAARPYLAGISEAQWTSLAFAAAVVAAGALGVLPTAGWHAALTAALALAAAGTLARRLARPPHERDLTLPAHLAELMSALSALERDPAALPVARTSRAIRLSAGRIQAETGALAHYAISGERPLSGGAARALARALVRRRHPQRAAELRAGSHGVFHVLVDATGAET